MSPMMQALTIRAIFRPRDMPFFLGARGGSGGIPGGMPVGGRMPGGAGCPGIGGGGICPGGAGGAAWVGCPATAAGGDPA
jgi:hypothetical protein